MWQTAGMYGLVDFTFFFFLAYKEEIKRVATVDTSILKQHYEKKLLELEHEKKSLQVYKFCCCDVCKI